MLAYYKRMVGENEPTPQTPKIHPTLNFLSITITVFLCSLSSPQLECVLCKLTYVGSLNLHSGNMLSVMGSQQALITVGNLDLSAELSHPDGAIVIECGYQGSKVHHSSAMNMGVAYRIRHRKLSIIFRTQIEFFPLSAFLFVIIFRGKQGGKLQFIQFNFKRKTSLYFKFSFNS